MIKEVLDVMVNLAQAGMTMMVVTHEMGFAREVARRVIFMDDGQIVEDRPKVDFFRSPGTDRAQQFLSKILSHSSQGSFARPLSTYGFVVLACIYKLCRNSFPFDSAVPLKSGFVLTWHKGRSNTCRLVPPLANPPLIPVNDQPGTFRFMMNLFQNCMSTFGSTQAQLS